MFANEWLSLHSQNLIAEGIRLIALFITIAPKVKLFHTRIPHMSFFQQVPISGTLYSGHMV